MKIKLITISDAKNIYIDIDRSGNLVAMTIEHARQQASLPFLSYEEIEAAPPRKPVRSTVRARN